MTFLIIRSLALKKYTEKNYFPSKSYESKREIHLTDESSSSAMTEILSLSFLASLFSFSCGFVLFLGFVAVEGSEAFCR